MSVRFTDPRELINFLEMIAKEPRRIVLKTISMRPGITTDELLHVVSASYRRITRNALYYHLSLLERAGLIRAEGSKPRRRFLAKKSICLVLEGRTIKDIMILVSVRSALALIILLALIFPSTSVYSTVEPKHEVLIVISRPLNDLYDQGFRYFLHRLNDTIHEMNYTTNFRLASSVELTPAIAANYSAVIVFMPNFNARYSNETTINALLTYLELSDRGMILIGNTDDVNRFLYRFGRKMGGKQENVTVVSSFTEPILSENYTFELNETATMVHEETNYTTTPPRRYPKDYDTFELMRTNESGSVAIAAETVDNSRFIAFTAVQAIEDDSTVRRGSIFKDFLRRTLGESYGKISVKSRDIRTGDEIKEGDVIEARVNLNHTPGKPEVYLEVYRGTVMSYKGEMEAKNDTYYVGSRTASKGQADVVIVIHVRGYGYRTSDYVHVIVYPNRKPAPIDPVLASLFIVSFIATLVGLIIVRREMEHA